jgi:hypothetical protein
VDDKPDVGGTTAVYEKVGLAWLPRFLRGRLTPAAMGSALTALCIAISYIVNQHHDFLRLQETVTRLEEERKESEADRNQDRELLHKIDKAVDVLNDKMDNNTTEIQRQRQRWDRVEEAADLPPHAARRRR